MRLYAIALLALCGCADRVYVPPPRSDGPEPALTIRVDNRVKDAMRIERLLVVLDGAVLYHRAGSGAWNVPQTIAAMDVPEGDHTMQMLVVASAPCGLLESPRWSMELRTAHSFTVARRTTRLRVTLVSRGATTQPNEMLRAIFEERQGGWISPSHPYVELPPVDTRVHYSPAPGCGPAEMIDAAN
jgi:hypothetical protein